MRQEQETKATPQEAEIQQFFLVFLLLLIFVLERRLLQEQFLFEFHELLSAARMRIKSGDGR